MKKEEKGKFVYTISRKNSKIQNEEFHNSNVISLEEFNYFGF